MHKKLVFILTMLAVVIGSLSQAAVASAASPAHGRLTAGTAPLSGPPKPTKVTATKYAPGTAPARVVLTWRERHGATVTGFIIQRAINSRFTRGFKTFRVPAYARKYTLAGLLRDEGYYIRIRAVKGHSTSRWVTVTITTPV